VNPDHSAAFSTALFTRTHTTHNDLLHTLFHEQSLPNPKKISRNLTSLVMSLPNAAHHHRRRSSSLERRDPFSSPSIYYDEEAVRRQLLGSRNRAVTSVSCLFPPFLSDLLLTRCHYQQYIKATRENALEAFKGNYPARRRGHGTFMFHPQSRSSSQAAERSLIQGRGRRAPSTTPGVTGGCRPHLAGSFGTGRRGQEPTNHNRR